MLNKRILAGIAGAMALGLAVPAMAQEVPTEESDTVEVQILIEAVAAIWAPDAPIVLTLDSPGADNWAVSPTSTLTHRNNTAADVTVGITHVSGPLLPDDLLFWLFRDMDATAAEGILAAETSADFLTGGTEGGSFSFSGADVNGGLIDALFANLAASEDEVDGDTFNVVYGADARASLPPPSDSHTLVTWTIAPAVSGGD